jgi:microcystin-dependent protein
MASVPTHTHARHEHDQYLEKVPTAQWLVPTGTIVAFGGTAAPTGWKICDGTAHGSAALTTLLGSANSPDLRDRFIVGAGSTYARGNTGGAATVTLSAAESGLRDHGHTASAPAHDVNHQHSGTTGDDSPDHGHNMAGWREPGYFGNTGARASFASLDSATGTYGMFGTSGATARHAHGFTTGWMNQNNSHGHTVTVNASGAAAATSAHENRPPYYALIYIIKT